MPLTLAQALDTSEALDERVAAARDPEERSLLEQKKIMADFLAFDLFKHADVGQAINQFGKPLAWGLGLGLPALGVGHALISDAHHQTEDLVNHARNQALLVGGLHALGGAAQSMLAPRTSADPSGDAGFKFSDDSALRKLAALLMVDDVIEATLPHAATADEKRAMTECLVINRVQGSTLLRKLRR